MNSQPEDKFEQRIRERLQSWEATPAENAWSRIVSDLPTRLPIWHRVIILGILISIVGGTILVWKWTMLEKLDEQIVQKEMPLSSSKSNTRKSHSPPLAGLPFSKTLSPTSSSFKAFADTTKSSTVSEEPSPLQVPRHGRYAGQHRAHENNTQLSDSASRAAGVQSTAYEYVRVPVDQKESDSQPFTTIVADQRDINSGLDSTVIHSIPTVSPINSYPAHINTQLSTIAIKVSSIDLPPQSRTLPESSSSESRWELWATTNPMLLYQRVTPDPSDAINVTSLNQSTFSKDRLGIQLSTGVRYRISPRIALALGAYYRHTRNRWTYNYQETLTDSFQVVAIDEKTIQARPLYQEQVGSVRQTNHYVGALVGVRYRLSSRWLSNTVGTELQVHYDHGQMVWFTQLSYLAEKTLSDHWSVFGGPTFLWNVSGNRQHYEYFTLKPYGFGAQLGINYRLSIGKRR